MGSVRRAVVCALLLAACAGGESQGEPTTAPGAAATAGRAAAEAAETRVANAPPQAEQSGPAHTAELEPRAAAGAEPVRLVRTASIEELRAAMKERVAFDDVRVEMPTEEKVLLVSKPGAVLDQHDAIVDHVRGLDAWLARTARLRALDDASLQREWDECDPVPPSSNYSLAADRQTVLLEIARRGGDAWRDRLRAKLAALDVWRDGQGTDGTRSWDARDLELLIALRHVEGRPAPVRMDVAVPEVSVYPGLPTVELQIVNRDERPITLTRGGNYRSGREERYHVEVRDAQGRIAPSCDWSGFGMGGGMYARERRAPGESLGTELPFANYVAPLPPGEYRATIRYSDVFEIAAADGHVGCVTVVGEAFTFRVEPRRVETTADAQRRLAALAEELPTTGPVQVLNGAYAEWAFEFVPPDSSAGRLLAADAEAVPVLVRFVQRKDADPVRRAWGFALLFSIVGQLDPVGTAAIGSYEVHSGGMRRVTGGGWTMVSGSGESNIDAAAQDALAASWAKIARGIEVRETK